MSNFTNAASKIYGQNQRGSSVNLFVPRNKFNFKVEITYLGGANGSRKTLILEKISEIQMPAHSIKTQTLNQYNKKRTIQTGIDYTPISLSAYDTRDAEIEKFLVGYNNHYYSSPMSDNYDIMEDDAISENFLSDESGKGFNLTNNRYYIINIKITRTSSKEDNNIIEIYNPIITNIQADTLNYSESAPVQYRIDFTYEGYKTTTNGIELAEEPVASSSSGTIVPRSVLRQEAISTVEPIVPATIAVVPGLSVDEAKAADFAEVYNDASAVFAKHGTLVMPFGPTVEFDENRQIHKVSVYNPSTNSNEFLTNKSISGAAEQLYNTAEEFEKTVSDYIAGQ
jgi:hypothetical protein